MITEGGLRDLVEGVGGSVYHFGGVGYPPLQITSLGWGGTPPSQVTQACLRHPLFIPLTWVNMKAQASRGIPTRLGGWGTPPLKTP